MKTKSLLLVSFFLVTLACKQVTKEELVSQKQKVDSLYVSYQDLQSSVNVFNAVSLVGGLATISSTDDTTEKFLEKRNKEFNLLLDSMKKAKIDFEFAYLKYRNVLKGFDSSSLDSSLTFLDGKKIITSYVCSTDDSLRLILEKTPYFGFLESKEIHVRYARQNLALWEEEEATGTEQWLALEKGTDINVQLQQVKDNYSFMKKFYTGNLSPEIRNNVLGNAPVQEKLLKMKATGFYIQEPNVMSIYFGDELMVYRYILEDKKLLTEHIMEHEIY